MSAGQESRPALSPGFLARYEILGTLGEGAMGAVYRARQRALGREVAIKFSRVRDVWLRERFLREGRILASLRHPNVIQCFDAGEEDDELYLVLELLDGASLAARIESEKRLPLEDVWSIGRQVCAGLGYVHEQGVLHRDLKPDNVLLTADGTAKLADFGLGRGAGGSRLTFAGTIMGTPGYMAPETARGEVSTTASDIYGLGAILYELLTGRPPYNQPDFASFFKAQSSGMPLPPSWDRHGLAPAADKLVLLCLDPDPSSRPAGAQQVEQALCDIEEGRIAPPPVSLPTRARDGAPEGGSLPGATRSRRGSPGESGDAGPMGARTGDLEEQPPPGPTRSRKRGSADEPSPGPTRARKRSVEEEPPPGPMQARKRDPVEGLRGAAPSPPRPQGTVSTSSPGSSGSGTVREIRRTSQGGPSGSVIPAKAGIQGAGPSRTVSTSTSGAPRALDPRAESRPGPAVRILLALLIGVAPGLWLGWTAKASQLRAASFAAARERVRESGVRAGEAAAIEARRATASVSLKVELPGTAYGQAGSELAASGLSRGVRVLSTSIAGGWALWTALDLDGARLQVTSIRSPGGPTARRDPLGLPEARFERRLPRLAPELPGLTYLGWNSRGREELRNEADGSILVFIPEGSFEMGSGAGDGDEGPVHPVALSAYLLGKYEVTWSQFERFSSVTGKPPPARPPGVSGEHPYSGASFEDAQEYAAWAGLRLPTEAEWEMGARGSDGRRYPWGDDPPDASRANIGGTDDGFAATAPVGSFPAGSSPNGCLDMAGNVWEYCRDWYADRYPAAAVSDPAGPESGSHPVKRGGGCRDSGAFVTTTFRAAWNPFNDYLPRGFRVAASSAKGGPR